MIDITPIITGIIALIGTVITVFLVPYLKTRLSSEQFTFLENTVKIAVTAAEVIFKGSGRGAEKYNYVLGCVKTFCETNKMTFDEKQVKNLIENYWAQLPDLKEDVNENA